MKTFNFAVLVLGLLVCVPAVAGPTDWNVTANLTVVEGTYMPTSITFQIDQNAGTALQCAAGNFLEYVGTNADNSKAIYALLLSSKLAGQTVTLFGSNTPLVDGNCQVNFVWAH